MSTVTNEQLLASLQSVSLQVSKVGDELKVVRADLDELKNRKSKSSSKSQPPITIDALASTNGLSGGTPAPGAAAPAAAVSSKKMAINLYFTNKDNYAKYEASLPEAVKKTITELKFDGKDANKSEEDKNKARRTHAWAALKADMSDAGKALVKKINDDRDALHKSAAPAVAPPAAAVATPAAAAPATAPISTDELAKLLASS